jgi:acetyl-CoA carboxylase biotin carboxyl carrier protein
LLIRAKPQNFLISESQNFSRSPIDRLYEGVKSTVELDLNQLRELIAALDQTDISEMILKSGDLELTVRKGIADGERVFSPADPKLQIADKVMGVPEDISSISGATISATPISPMPSAAGEPSQKAGASSPGTPAAPPSLDNKWVVVTAPMVGTFYRAPAPDEPPFVKVGDRVSIGQTVCIIEAMKLMNEIEAEVSGQVMEIVVDNAQPVEYEQVLMRIQPD